MIAIVTLNPCIDVSLYIPSFTRGGMNRVSRSRADFSGKGINVSIALKNLGIDNTCLGFNYKENGGNLCDLLENMGIGHDFVWADGATRTNNKVHEEDTGTMTEFNQAGAYIKPELVDELLEKIRALNPEILVLSGSRPQGVEEDIYKKIMESCDSLVFLDTEKGALRLGIESKNPPFALKPNLFELEAAYGEKFSSINDISNFSLQLTKQGPKMICVSMGGDGAVFTTSGESFYAPALDVKPLGVQGVGDSMIAGMIYALTKGLGPDAYLRWAIAAASASIIREGSLMCTFEDSKKMYERVKVEKIS